MIRFICMDSNHPWRWLTWYAPPLRTALTPVDTFSTEWIEDTNPLIEEVKHLKESIQPYDKTDMWDLAKRITNPYELIYTTSSRLALPKSTACLQPLSRSFFKMIEILVKLDFFKRHKDQKLKSLHVCEGPGGFMEAFLHVAEQERRNPPNVYAMTLKSTHTIIPGWRRATQFLQRQKTVHLLYGPSKSGNIYERENQDECVHAVRDNSKGAQFVTGDGGFDFSEDFCAQEKSMIRLLVCSALILLRGVAQDGDFVLKIFDFYSPCTRDIIALLASCFQSWTLYKPATSRPCNSECYFLGKSALQSRDHAIQLLQRAQEWLETHDSLSRLYTENPLDTILQSIQESRLLTQKEALLHVLAFCKETHTNAEIDDIWKTQRIPSIQWCYQFRIPTVFRMKDFS